MGKRADTASEGNLNATRNCHSSAFFTQRLQAVFSAGGLGIARGVVAERIVICSKLQVDAFLFHQVRSGFARAPLVARPMVHPPSDNFSANLLPGSPGCLRRLPQAPWWTPACAAPESTHG